MPAALLAAVALAVPAAAPACPPPHARVVATKGAIKVYALSRRPGKPHFACRGAVRARLWRHRLGAGFEDSFDLPRLAGGRVAWVDYRCTTDGRHTVHVRVLDVRTGRRRAWPALDAAPILHVEPRVLELRLGGDGTISWSAELAGPPERHRAHA